MTRRKRRQTRPYKQRLVETVIPADSIFRFTAPARSEGSREKGGLRVTLPRPVVRGLQHLGWAGFRLRARINGGASFIVRARHPNDLQSVISLPKEHRGQLAAGDPVALELELVRHD